MTDERSENKSRIPILTTDLGHSVVKALQSSNYEIDNPTSFINTVRNIDFGLGAEVEFATIAAWLGRARLVHLLDGKRTVSPGLPRDLLVPDGLCILEFANERRTVLVEIKTTEGLILRVKEKYLEGLKHYASMTEFPVLIAWRPRAIGLWVVFDPFQTPRDAERQVFAFKSAIAHNLLGAVFGDFLVELRQGVGISIRAEFIGSKRPTESGYQATVKITEVWFHNSEGQRIAQPPEGVFAALLACCEEKVVESDTGFTVSWVAQGGTTSAQSILRMIVGLGLQDGERIRWRGIGETLDRLLSRTQLLNDLNASRGNIANSTFHQIPKRWPEFVPDAWRLQRWKASETIRDPRRSI